MKDKQKTIKQAIKDLKTCTGFILIATKDDNIGKAVYTESSNELARLLLEVDMFSSMLREKWAMYNNLDMSKKGEKNNGAQNYFG